MKKTQTVESLKDPRADFQDYQPLHQLSQDTEFRKKTKHLKNTFTKVQEETALIDVGSNSASYQNDNQTINSPKLNVPLYSNPVDVKSHDTLTIKKTRPITIEGIDVEMQADFQDFTVNDEESDEFSSQMIK